MSFQLAAGFAEMNEVVKDLKIWKHKMLVAMSV